MKIRVNTILLDALYNLRDKTGANPDYCKGLVIGLIAGLMAKGETWAQSIQRIRESLPKNYRPDCLPQIVRDDLAKQE